MQCGLIEMQQRLLKVLPLADVAPDDLLPITGDDGPCSVRDQKCADIGHGIRHGHQAVVGRLQIFFAP